jgi:predicted transcriptional regulator
MPKRTKVKQLPKAIKTWLDRALAENGFSQYESLAAALGKKGFAISKSSLHRYGRQFEARVEQIRTATEMAKVIVETNPDDDNSQNEALIRLCQERIMQLLVETKDGDDAGTLVKLTRAIADLARASVNQKRYREEVEGKAKSAAEKAAKIARRGGVSKASAEAIQKLILGIAA